MVFLSGKSIWYVLSASHNTILILIQKTLVPALKIMYSHGIPVLIRHMHTRMHTHTHTHTHMQHTQRLFCHLASDCCSLVGVCEVIVWCVFKHCDETVYPLYIEEFRQDLCEYGQYALGAFALYL